ncbi:hypothetical protein [Jeotgalibacillus marinus]|uniref:Coupling factor for flagellin transcription and translation n=1 Tax=Jeotgalibacillus marinus TaxID=86667 RepID=A0ABV3Q362_9BACL
MIHFLLILSILFNFVAFLSIYLLFLRQNRLIHKEEKQQKDLIEFEETFTSYLLEMKEDNAVFLQQFEQLQNEQLQTKPKERVISDDKINGNKEIPSSIMRASRSLAANRYHTPQIPKRSKETGVLQGIKEETIEEKVTRLCREGMSIADIAKSLGKGQTEIELMLKFHKKEE